MNFKNTQAAFILVSLALACSSLSVAQAAGQDSIINKLDSVKPVIVTDDVIDLDELLQRTRLLQAKEKALHKQREAEFLAQKSKQKKLVDDAKSQFLETQKIANPLLKVTASQQSKIESLQAQLNKHSNELGDMHSIYKQFSGDFIAHMKDSLVQAQFPQRLEQLNQLQASDKLASIQEMRTMWTLLIQEMTEAGKNSLFEADVINPQGKSQKQNVIRLGTFSVFSNGKFLSYIPQNQELMAIDQQPTEKSIMIAFSESTAAGVSHSNAIIDPSRGDLLTILGQSPSLYERMLQGKEVGFAILFLGLLGLFIILYRLVYLTITWLNTQKQLKDLSKINSNNPLGRIFLQVQQLDETSKSDEESLQLTLDEAIIKELPKLEQGHSLIKLFSAIAPLLGLLGTVIGMIATFQSISLFGSGDAKLMAGGISQALVTTVLGLTVAIPLLLSHNLLVSFSKVLLQILDEQSAGILAKDRESEQVVLKSSE